MIDKQTIKEWKRTADMFVDDVFNADPGWLGAVCLKENNFIREIIKAIEQDQLMPSPCDLCKFDPPSSGDGKPCCMCPACGKG